MVEWKELLQKGTLSCNMHKWVFYPMLQIKRGNRDNDPYFFIKTFCYPSLEPPRRDSSNEGLQHTFLLRNYEKLSLNYPQRTL